MLRYILIAMQVKDIFCFWPLEDLFVILKYLTVLNPSILLSTLLLSIYI